MAKRVILAANLLVLVMCGVATTALGASSPDPILPTQYCYFGLNHADTGEPIDAEGQTLYKALRSRTHTYPLSAYNEFGCSWPLSEYSEGYDEDTVNGAKVTDDYGSAFWLTTETPVPTAGTYTWTGRWVDDDYYGYDLPIYDPGTNDGVVVEKSAYIRVIDARIVTPPQKVVRVRETIELQGESTPDTPGTYSWEITSGFGNAVFPGGTEDGRKAVGQTVSLLGVTTGTVVTVSMDYQSDKDFSGRRANVGAEPVVIAVDGATVNIKPSEAGIVFYEDTNQIGVKVRIEDLGEDFHYGTQTNTWDTDTLPVTSTPTGKIWVSEPVKFDLDALDSEKPLKETANVKLTKSSSFGLSEEGNHQVVIEVRLCETCDKCIEVTVHSVDLFTGAKKESETDVSIERNGQSWSFGRSYDNQEFKRTILGYNWESSWGRRLFMRDSDGDMLVDALDSAPYTGRYWFSEDDLDSDLVDNDHDPVDNDANIPRLDLYGPSLARWQDESTEDFGTRIMLEPVDPSRLPNNGDDVDQAQTVYFYRGLGSGERYFTDQNSGSTRDYVSPLASRTNELRATGFDTSECRFALRHASGQVDTFYGFHNPPKLTDGRLLSTTDPEGRTISLIYDSFGRVVEFRDDNEDTIATLAYYDDVQAAYASTEKLNRLHTVTDYTSRQVVYDYDAEGNLTSVNVFGRETRYAYSLKSQYPDSPALQHNLTNVYLPVSVEAAPNDPLPFKEIAYGTDPEDPSFDRVISEFVGEKQGATIVSGGTQTFAYYDLNDTSVFEGDSNSGMQKAVTMTRHTKESGEVVDMYFNFGGMVVKTIRRSGEDELVSTREPNEYGQVPQTTDAEGRTGQSIYFDVAETAFLGLGRYLQDLVTSTTAEGCGSCGGGSGGDVQVTYTYEPLTGQWRTKCVDGISTTTRFFDYQEYGMATVKSELAKKFFCVASPTSAQQDAVEELLNYVAIPVGLGDLNGIVDANGFVGLVVREDKPSIKMPDDSYRNAVTIRQYDDDGDVIAEFDPEGNRTAYTYHPITKRLIERHADTSYSAFTSAVGTDYAHTVDPINRNSGANPPVVDAKWTYAYDTRGNRTAETDPRGVTTSYTYNAFDELTQTTRASSVDAGYGQSPAEPSESAAPGLQAFAFITKNTYDAAGNLVKTEVEDRTGAAGCGDWVETLYTYDIFGRRLTEQREVSTGNYETTRYYYDASGRQVLVIHPDGTASFTEYDGFGRTVRVISGLTSSLGAAQWDTIVNPPGAEWTCSLLEARNTVEYSYNTKGQLETTSLVIPATPSPEYRTTRYSYDEMGRKVRQEMTADPYARVTKWEYDSLGRVSNVYVQGAFDKDHRETTCTLSRTHTVYDIQGRVLQTNRWLAIPDDAEYTGSPSLSTGWLTAAGNPRAADAPAGFDWIATRKCYDLDGRVRSVMSDNGAITTRTYDGMGRVLTTFDVAGNMTENWYDDAGSVIETRRTDAATLDGTASETFVTTMFYDSLGRLVTQVDNMGNATDMRYDTLSRTVAMTDANGPNAEARSFYRRGATSALVQTNDYGNATIMTYDGLGRRTREDRVMSSTGLGAGVVMGRTVLGGPETIPGDPNQAGDGLISVLYAYDAGGRLASLTDDNGNCSEWSYDSQGRKVSETKGINDALTPADVDATTIEWTYNDDGTVDYMTKEDGTVVTYTSDNAGRVTQIDITRATGVVGTTQQTFDYDPAGRRVRATDNNAPNTSDDDVTVTWAYDSLGRLIQESQKVGLSGTVRTVTYDYTSTRRSAVTYPNGRQIDYAYHDFGGALETLSDNGPAEIVRYEYIGGRTLKREMANGVDLDMRDGSGGTLYDALGRPTEWKHLDSNQNVVIGFSYGYDRVGNKRWQRVLHDTRDSQRYAYDSASRLTAFVRGDFGATEQDWCEAATTQPRAGMTQARQWTLDGVGNWSQVATKTDGNTATESRTDTSFNEYSSIGGVSQSHDDNGNLTDDGTYEYEWDALNRLVSVSDGATHATIVTYAYDPGNRRMLLDEATASTSDTLYYYAGWQVVEERAASTGALQRQFVYGNYIDEPLVMNADGNADGDCLDAGTDPAYYYLQNTLFSVYALTDASGAVVEAYSYDPYGNHTLHLDGSDAGSSVDFTSDDLRFEEGHAPSGSSQMFLGFAWNPHSASYDAGQNAYTPARGRVLARTASGSTGSGYVVLFSAARQSGKAQGLGSMMKGVFSTNGEGPLDPDRISERDLRLWRSKWTQVALGAGNATSGMWSFAGKTKDPLAAVFMMHFLYGNGSPIEIDWKSTFYDKDVGRQAEGVISKAFDEMKRIAEADPRSKQLGKVTLSLTKDQMDNNLTSSDYFYSIKDYTLVSRHVVDFTFVDGCLRSSADVHPVMMVDRYDWGNNDQNAQVKWHGIGYTLWDAEGWAMVQHGYAHTFDISSSYIYSTAWSKETGLVIW